MSAQAPPAPTPDVRYDVRAAAATADAVDFDVHGLVGIRLLDAERRDIASVGRQLGIAPTPLEREPDILVRFVDRLTRIGATP